MTDAQRVFVGRTVELARVGELLETIQRGRTGALFVLGEPGVGKTRLLAEARSIAMQRKIRVAAAACLPLTTVLPFDPVFELLRTLGAPLGARLTRGSPLELFDVVVERLEQASVEGPLLLCLDDLQWSDAATVDLVHYCLARLSDLPLGWLLAARSGRAAAPVVHRLERERLVQRLELRSLSYADTRLLAHAVLDSAEISEDVLAAVHQRTGGNPFLSEALLRALAQPRSPGAGSAAGSTGQVNAVMPVTVREAIEVRADRLSAPARAALEWAAVLPERFTFAELETVGGADAGLAPEELADTGFLVRDDDGRWEFVHSIVHDAVYHRLPEAERVRRHGAVADALAGGPLERVAPQLERARRFGGAAAAYEKLAEQSLNRGQGEDAVRLYALAAELASAGGEQRLARHARAGRVLALVRVRRVQEARDAASEVRAELRKSGDPEEWLRFLSRFATELMLAQVAADLEIAREALEEAEPLIEQAGGVALAEALATRAWLWMRSGESTRALVDAERAAELAQGSRNAALEATVLNPLGLAIGMTRSASEGMRVLERAAERAQAADLPAQAGRAYANLSYLADHADEGAAIEIYARRGLELDGVAAATRTQLHSNLAVRRGLIGDLDGALPHHLAAMRLAERGGPRAQQAAAAALAYVHIWRGELAAARRLLERYEVLPDSRVDTRAPELWGLLREAEGAPADALAHYQTGALIDDPNSMWCETGAARTAVATGDLRAARASLERIDELVERWPVGEWMRQEARGWLAVSEHRTSDAINHFQAAADGCSRAYDAAWLRLEAARLAADREQLLAAIDEFERIGAKRGADQARATARTLGIRVGRRRDRSGPLSPREQEVAQLIAAGNTNAEIAATLYLSPRTVERHVGNLLTKLGYRSRIQIATDAAAGRLPGAATSVEAPVTT